MNRLVPRLLGVLVLLAGSIATAQVPPPPTPPPDAPQAMPLPAPPQLPARSYLLVDFHSGDEVVAHEADLRVAPASITKLMTSYVVFAELARGNLALDETVAVSENAWRTGGSRMFIDPTMQVTVEELILGVVVQSGNDACVALAEHIAGSEDAFATMMNHYAQQLGMADTNFVNATGLPDPEHYTTARDIAALAAALIRDFPDYYPWYSVKEFTFNDIRQHNRNNLLWRDPAVDGLKTGHTEEAGYCLAASAKRDDMRLISVVMGSASEATRASETQTLLNYGFRFFETIPIYEAGAELAEGEVWKGESRSIPLGLADDLVLTVPRGRYDDLDAQLELPATIEAPLEEGEPVGEVLIRLDDQTLATRPLVALAAVPAAGFFGRTMDGMRLWVGGLFGGDDDQPESE